MVCARLMLQSHQAKKFGHNVLQSTVTLLLVHRSTLQHPAVYYTFAARQSSLAGGPGLVSSAFYFDRLHHAEGYSQWMHLVLTIDLRTLISGPKLWREIPHVPTTFVFCR